MTGVFVDSSVWIDYFNGVHSEQTDRFDQLLDRGHAMTGDLVALEVLQGFRHQSSLRVAEKLLASVPLIEIAGVEAAWSAAANHRTLRGIGITVRSSIDTLIATRCILDRIPLLTADRDFLPFAEHLGLELAEPPAPA